MGLLRFCGRALLDFIIITIAILLFPGIPPNAEFDDTRFAPSPALEGPLAPNDRLSPLERLLEGRASGPESTAEWRGAVYTGVEGGALLRVDDDGGAEPVAWLGGGCDDPEKMANCGRPLGMRFDRHGQLFVADAYLGIHKVNVTSGAVEVVVPAGVQVGGTPLRFFNDVVPTQDGILYFTTSSSVCDIHTGFIELAVKGTGRLFRHDPKRNVTEVLMSGVNFANGVALNSQESALIVAETGMFRVHRYWLKGEKAGTSEVFSDNLPGFPDNIRARAEGGYYVGLCDLRQQAPLHELLRPHPLITKLIVRLVSLALTPVKLIDRAYPNRFTHTVIYKALTLKTLKMLTALTMQGPTSAGGGMVLELDARGAVVGSLHTADMSCVSQLSEHGGALYAGSPFHGFLGRARPAGRTVRLRTVQSDGSMSIGV